LDRKHVLSKKQTCFRLLEQVSPVSISLSFPMMVENGGTGSSSTGKSLLEALHEGRGGKESWETQNKITESDTEYGKDMSWNEVFVRNSVGLVFKSMCRDEHGQSVARYDDSGRNPIGVDIVYHYATSPTGTDRLPSETTLPIVTDVTSSDFAPSTPISTTSTQQFEVGALRKQKWRSNIALQQEQTKKKANVTHIFIPYSPSKRSQENLKTAKRCDWSENMGGRMVAAVCSVQMKSHLEDLDKVPDRHELEANKGNQKTMKHDVFFETLTLNMNDPDFSGDLPFHDDHLDGKDGKPGIFQHRGTWTVSQVRQNFMTPPPQSCTCLLHKGCFRLIHNTKHWFVFFIPEKQKIRLELFDFVKPRFSNITSNTSVFVFMLLKGQWG
jgi:hypothetical protein